MNLLILYLVFVIFVYVGGSNVPKVLSNKKELLLGILIGFVVYPMLSLEGIDNGDDSNNKPDELPDDIDSREFTRRFGGNKAVKQSNDFLSITCPTDSKAREDGFDELKSVMQAMDKVCDSGWTDGSTQNYNFMSLKKGDDLEDYIKKIPGKIGIGIRDSKMLGDGIIGPQSWLSSINDEK